MRKKTSTIIGLTITTILIAYISTLTLSNQAFAQRSTDGNHQLGISINIVPTDNLGQPASNSGHIGHSGLLGSDNKGNGNRSGGLLGGDGDHGDYPTVVTTVHSQHSPPHWH